MKSIDGNSRPNSDWKAPAQTVPSACTLSTPQSLYGDRLRARAEREQGLEGVPVEKLLPDMNRIIEAAERGS